MITYSGHKVTANEFAKMIVEDRGALAYEFWSEDSACDYEAITEREAEEITAAIGKQLDRIRKLLGWYALRDKVYAREDHSEAINKRRYG